MFTEIVLSRTPLFPKWTFGSVIFGLWHFFASKLGGEGSLQNADFFGVDDRRKEHSEVVLQSSGLELWHLLLVAVDLHRLLAGC